MYTDAKKSIYFLKRHKNLLYYEIWQKFQPQEVG